MLSILLCVIIKAQYYTWVKECGCYTEDGKKSLIASTQSQQLFLETKVFARM